MSLVNSTHFSELLEPGIGLIYGTSYKRYPEQYSKVFDVQTSARSFEESFNMSGFGLVPTKAQGIGVSYDAPIKGSTHRHTHLTYGKGFMITEEMYEDDLYKQMRALPEALARSVRITIETEASDIYNNAFNSAFTGADGLELCSTVHTLLGGGTYANELSTAADLDMTSLEQALIDIAALVDDRGLLLYASARKLVVPPELDWQGKRLLKSAMDPETANNSTNPAVGSFPEGMFVYNYLTDPDAWFILTDVPNGPVFYWRRRPAFTKDNDFDSDNAKWKTTFRMSSGWDDPRGVFGSPGA